ERLGELAKQQGTSVHAVMLAAFAMTIRRSGATADVCIGNFASGAQWLGSKRTPPTVGFFVSGFPVRVRIDAETRGADVLKEVRGQIVRASARRYDLHPMADVYACSDVPTGQPLYDLVFNFVQGEA